MNENMAALSDADLQSFLSHLDSTHRSLTWLTNQAVAHDLPDAKRLAEMALASMRIHANVRRISSRHPEGHYLDERGIKL